MASTTTDDPAVAEVAPGRVYGLGGAVALDGRISWAPARAGGYEPVNCYLLLADGSALLIDTGVPAHDGEILAQLGGLVPAGARLSALLTRTELDCALNVPAIDRRFGLDALRYTGGITVPCGEGCEVERFGVEPGGERVIECAPGLELTVISPLLRLLPTLWPYDPVSRTLFTSDAFGHVHCPHAGAPRVVRDDSGFGDEDVRRHLLVKLGWLAGTDTRAVAADVEAIFARHPVETIAPTHGCILAGAELVRRHADLLVAAIRSVGR